jgi:hypothetical protein
LTRKLDSMPDMSDADMALMYLRHLRRRRAAAVPVVCRRGYWWVIADSLLTTSLRSRRGVAGAGDP